MPIHTQESLQKLFEASKRRQQRLKEEETKKYRKAQQAVKKALDKQQSTKDEKLAQKAQKRQTEAFSRTISIYNSKYVERFIGEDDLYTTREELMEAEQRGEGKIKWDKWDSLVNKTKKDLKKK